MLTYASSIPILVRGYFFFLSLIGVEFIQMPFLNLLI